MALAWMLVNRICIFANSMLKKIINPVTLLKVKCRQFQQISIVKDEIADLTDTG